MNVCIGGWKTAVNGMVAIGYILNKLLDVCTLFGVCGGKRGSCGAETEQIKMFGQVKRIQMYYSSIFKHIVYVH